MTAHEILSSSAAALFTILVGTSFAWLILSDHIETAIRSRYGDRACNIVDAVAALIVAIMIALLAASSFFGWRL